MQSLKEKILTNIDEWKALGETRFIVLDSSSVTKLTKIIAPGSKENNTDLTNRGFVLGKLLKHSDSTIWDKVDKDKFKKDFAGIDAEYEHDKMVQECTKILAKAIDDKFTEDVS